MVSANTARRRRLGAEKPGRTERGRHAGWRAGSKLFSTLGVRPACWHECRHGTEECVRHVGSRGKIEAHT